MLLVVDMVESVALMQRDEARTIACWRRFVQATRQSILPATSGHLVKSLGDGLLARFDQVADAIEAARSMRRASAELRDDASGLPEFWLRMAVHAGDVEFDDLDIYGRDVNLAARLCTLAAPDGVVVSSSVRDRLRDGWDARLVDLGECYLKHFDEPVRAWRLDESSGEPLANPGPPRDVRWQMRLLFAPEPGASPQQQLLLEALVPELADSATRHSGWRVISPLSARRLGVLDPERASRPVADMLVWVQLCARDGSRMRIRLRAERWRDGHPMGHAESETVREEQVLQDPAVLVDLLRALATSIGHRVQQWVHQMAATNLPSYALLNLAIEQLHSSEAGASERAKTGLAALVERHPRAAALRYWQAKTEFMGIVQHRAPDPRQAMHHALERLQRALDIDPDHGASLALRHHILRVVEHREDVTDSELRATAEAHPSEPLAWLFLSGALALNETGEEACEAARRAWALSPIDPLDFFYLTFAAAAHVAGGQFGPARAMAERAVRLNGQHLPGLSVLMISQVLDGEVDSARRTAQRYLQLRPQASVSHFLKGHPRPDDPLTRRDAEALRVAGIPS